MIAEDSQSLSDTLSHIREAHVLTVSISSWFTIQKGFSAFQLPCHKLGFLTVTDFLLFCFNPSTSYWIEVFV